MKKELFPSGFAKVGPDGDQTVNLDVGCLPKVNKPLAIGILPAAKGMPSLRPGKQCLLQLWRHSSVVLRKGVARCGNGMEGGGSVDLATRGMHVK